MKKRFPKKKNPFLSSFHISNEGEKKTLTSKPLTPFPSLASPQ
jgi:hypothetical protein